MARTGRGKPCGDSFIAANKQCNVGKLSQRVNKGMLARATTQKLQEYLNKAPYQYQRDAIKAELDRRAGGAAQNGPTNRGLQKQKDKLDKEQKALQLELDGLIAQRDGKKPADDKMSQKVGKKFLQQAATEKLEEYLRKAPYQYQRDKIAAALMERQKKDLAKAATNKPDSKWGKWGDDQLRDKLKAAKNLGDVNNVGRIEAEMRRRGLDPNKRPTVKENPEGIGSFKRKELDEIDQKVEAKTTAQFGEKGFDWSQSLLGTAKVLGAGAFGTAIQDASGFVVKRGELGPNEAPIFRKVHELGLAPRMIAAELDGASKYTPGTKIGRLAMGLAEGLPIGNRRGPEIERAYWTARAALHRGGVAHNDMHIKNVFVGPNGKGQFVDLGLAQDSPKAALAEAMGAFVSGPRGTIRSSSRTGGREGQGDWQVQRWDNIGGEDFARADRRGDRAEVESLKARFPTAYKVYANKEKAINEMRSMGLTDQDISDVIFHGIRSKESSYDVGAMGKLTDQQALKIINTLYDGI